MEEMQRLIGKRVGEFTPRTRPLSMVASASLSRLSDDGSSTTSNNEVVMSTIDELASQAEGDISKALQGHSQLMSGMKTMTSHLKEVCGDSTVVLFGLY